MTFGDKITLFGVEWELRPFTPAEHERFEVLAESYGLRSLAANVQALKGSRSGTMRERLINGRKAQLEKELQVYLENDDLRTDLSEDERVQAFYLAAQVDMYVEQLESVKNERVAQIFIVEDQLIEAQEQVITEFMFELLKPEIELDEFRVKLTEEELSLMDRVVNLGKLPTGLSAWTRRQVMSWAQVLEIYQQQQNGNGSESPPQQPDALKKRGRNGRSKKSSSKSKVGV